MSSNQSTGKILKGFAIAAAATVGTYIVVKLQLNERRRQRYEDMKNRVPGHEYQKIAEVERHDDGAANPSSEEANDPSFGRQRRS
ncbi:hypothetical protein V1522DRAFT_418879 [Lipomyces starkeyi]